MDSPENGGRLDQELLWECHRTVTGLKLLLQLKVSFQTKRIKQAQDNHSNPNPNLSLARASHIPTHDLRVTPRDTNLSFHFYEFPSMHDNL